MRVVDVKEFCLHGFHWLKLRRIAWQDHSGRVRFWESAERTTRRGEVDGVAIIAKVLRAGQPPHIVVISQYRPPLANICLELPAGLVEAGEDVAVAALRELQEETGYVGRVVEVLPPCGSDPGMSSCNLAIALVEVDGDAPANQDVVQNLDDGEFITVALVPMLGLRQYLLETQAERGWEVDARLMSYAGGLAHGAALAGAEVNGDAAAAAIERPGPAAASEAAEPSGSAASAAQGLQGFGSLVPDDSELGHAAEAAIAAVGAHPVASPRPAGGGAKEDGHLRAPRPGSPQQQWRAAAGVANGGEVHYYGRGPATRLWRWARSYACTPQFGLGLAVGVAVAVAAAAAAVPRLR